MPILRGLARFTPPRHPPTTSHINDILADHPSAPIYRGLPQPPTSTTFAPTTHPDRSTEASHGPHIHDIRADHPSAQILRGLPQSAHQRHPPTSPTSAPILQDLQQPPPSLRTGLSSRPRLTSHETGDSLAFVANELDLISTGIHLQPPTANLPRNR
ncbi:hypothetical protein T492DRAFT_1011568, partial [Pavlovales sp. CCMP2436]